MKNEIKTFFYLVTGFVFATIIGTITHEFGHFLAAKLLDCNPSLHFSSTSYSSAGLISKFDHFLIILSGPLQTILTGTVGLFLLVRHRTSFYKSTSLTFLQWILVFTTLFWLRPLANFALSMVGFLTNGRFSLRDDESKLDVFLNLQNETILRISACIAGIILISIVNYFIPKRQILVFLAAGIVGGSLGYFLWLVKFGKVILP